MHLKEFHQTLSKFNSFSEKHIYPLLLIFLIFLLSYILLKNVNISLHFDELWTVAKTNKDLSLFTVIYNSSIQDTWPPLYYILLHYIQVFMGNTEVCLRSISILSTIFSFLALYLLTKKIYSKQEAVLTCTFFTFSSFLHIYALEIRGYSLFLFLSICSFYFLVKFLQDNRNIYLVTYFCVAFLCSFTHYFGLYLVLFQLLYLALNKQNFIIKYRSNLILFLLLLFLYPVFHLCTITNTFVLKNISFFEHNTAFNNHFNRTFFIFKDFIPSLKINLFNNLIEQLLLYSSLIYCFIKIKIKQNRFLLYFILLPLLLLFLESFIFKSFLETRFFIFLFPLIYILIAHFIKSIIPDKFFNLVLIIVLFLLTTNLQTAGIKTHTIREQILSVKKDINNLQNTIFVHEQNYHIEYYLNRFNINNTILPVQWNPDIEKIADLFNNYKNIYIIYEFENSALKHKNKLEKNFNLTQQTKQIYLLKQKENLDT